MHRPHPSTCLLGFPCPLTCLDPPGFLFGGFELYRGLLKLEGALVGGQRGRGSLVLVSTGPHCSSLRPVLLLSPHPEVQRLTGLASSALTARGRQVQPPVCSFLMR